MRALGALALLVVLAGCAEPERAPASPMREPTVPTTVVWGRSLETFEATLFASSYHLAPPENAASFEVDVPNGTVSASFVVRFMGGAGTNFAIRLGGCSFDATVVPGDGRNVTKDCGGVGEGTQTLDLRLGTGTLDGDVTVIGRLCKREPGTCPRAP